MAAQLSLLGGAPVEPPPRREPQPRREHPQPSAAYLAAATAYHEAAAAYQAHHTKETLRAMSDAWTALRNTPTNKRTR